MLPGKNTIVTHVTEAHCDSSDMFWYCFFIQKILAEMNVC